MTGLCECGCGQRTALATKTRRGLIKGQPRRFILGHQARGERNSRWRGGRMGCRGYEMVVRAGHPRAHPGGYVREHVLVAERVLGRLLPDGAQVHHINGDRADNRPANLVICQDASYHQMLHQRLNALRACGNPRWRKCKYCKQYDSPASMYIDPTSQSAHHRACRRARRNGT